MTETNLALREYVTSVGFQLTLSQRMIDVLVALDHFKGDFEALMAWERASETRRRLFNHYVSTFGSLEKRGLVHRDIHHKKSGLVDPEKSRHRVTKAGRLTIGLLKEAGLYQERIKEMGLQ